MIPYTTFPKSFKQLPSTEIADAHNTGEGHKWSVKLIQVAAASSVHNVIKKWQFSFGGQVEVWKTNK